MNTHRITYGITIRVRNAAIGFTVTHKNNCYFSLVSNPSATLSFVHIYMHKTEPELGDPKSNPKINNYFFFSTKKKRTPTKEFINETNSWYDVSHLFDEQKGKKSSSSSKPAKQMYAIQMKQEKWFIKNEMPTRAKKTTHWRRRRKKNQNEMEWSRFLDGMFCFFFTFNGPMNKIFWRMPWFYVSIGWYILYIVICKFHWLYKTWLNAVPPITVQQKISSPQQHFCNDDDEMLWFAPQGTSTTPTINSNIHYANKYDFKYITNSRTDDDNPQQNATDRST